MVGRLSALLALLATVLLVPTTPAASVGTTHADIAYHSWADPAAWRTGVTDGVVPAGRDRLAFGHAIGQIRYADPFGHPPRRYEYGRWTSPFVAPGFGLTELVASWTADTPAGSWLQVQLRGHAEDGHRTGWYVLGRWASGDGDVHRTSVPDQADADGDIAVDTFFAASSLRDYQLRVTLYRAVGSGARPELRSVGAFASALPSDSDVPTGAPGVGRGIELDVPAYSQNVHVGEYPEYDGGGEAWCSPTATEMVTEYWGQYPSAEQLSWVDPSYDDPSVDVAARGTFDYSYDGAGNWPFNVAYAATYGLTGQVTQLRSLAEAKRFIAAGIPLITSVSFDASELDGAGYSTSGHLMVIVGFTPDGDVIANDPASPDNAAVRHVYRRDQFADVWLPTSRSGGIVYVIRPVDVPLPAHVPGLPANW